MVIKNKIYGGYKHIFFPKHPKASKTSGYVAEHILVMEKKLNRKMKDKEIVHHKDENKLNNDPENLLLCKNSKEHQVKYHRKTHEEYKKQMEKMREASKNLDRSYPRHHKKTILQYHSNRYTLTIPRWFVNKVLCAKKGSVIKFDLMGNKVILEKE